MVHMFRYAFLSAQPAVAGTPKAAAFLAADIAAAVAASVAAAVAVASAAAAAPVDGARS